MKFTLHKCACCRARKSVAWSSSIPTTPWVTSTPKASWSSVCTLLSSECDQQLQWPQNNLCCLTTDLKLLVDLCTLFNKLAEATSQPYSLIMSWNSKKILKKSTHTSSVLISMNSHQFKRKQSMQHYGTTCVQTELARNYLLVSDQWGHMTGPMLNCIKACENKMNKVLLSTPSIAAQHRDALWFLCVLCKCACCMMKWNVLMCDM